MPSGSGLHASSAMVVFVDVAYTGSAPVILKGSVWKYVIGSCRTPPTVAFCSGIIVLSKLATLMASIAFPGLLVYHDPNAPSLPAAMVTMRPDAARREATVEDVEDVQPSAPPMDSVMMSCPSAFARRSASTMTEEIEKEKCEREERTHYRQGQIRCSQTRGTS